MADKEKKRIIEFAAIIGVDKTPVVPLYNVLIARWVTDFSIGREDNANEWEFKLATWDARKVAELAGKLNIENAEVKDYKIVGKYASLDRFDNNKSAVVLLTVIKNAATSEIVGYKIVNQNGIVKNIKLAELLAYCKRATRGGLTPMQNAVYVEETNDENGKKADFIRLYRENQIFSEYIGHPEKRVQPQKNELNKIPSKASKMEELFTPEQIEVLRKAKAAGLDIRVIGNNKLSPEQMTLLSKMMKHGFNARPFANPKFSPDSLKFYTSEMKYKLDIRPIINPEFKLEQLSALGSALDDRLPIGAMNDPKIPASEMWEIYERLLKGIWKKEFKVVKE